VVCQNPLLAFVRKKLCSRVDSNLLRTQRLVSIAHINAAIKTKMNNNSNARNVWPSVVPCGIKVSTRQVVPQDHWKIEPVPGGEECPYPMNLAHQRRLPVRRCTAIGSNWSQNTSLLPSAREVMFYCSRHGKETVNSAPSPAPALRTVKVPPSSLAARAPLCRPKPCPSLRVVKP
jgi:hypothetical protein